MAETRFQRLSAEERRQALRTVQSEGPHPAFLFEKDIWVVATLGVLFDAPFGQRLVFKGGTSRESFGAIRPEVQVDFGARSTGEPHAVRAVVCDAAAYLPDLAFPEARPTVMLAEIPLTSGSTTKRRSRAVSGSFHPALRRRCSPPTTPACLAAGCCWKRMSRLTRSWIDAR